MLLSNTNQDAATTIKCLERLTELPEWKKNKRLYFWADSGRHFLNAPLLSFVYDLPGFCSFSFFAGRHGKNDCDSHFGVVRRKLEDASRQRKIETLPEGAQVLDTINNTTNCVLNIPRHTLTLSVFQLRGVSAVHSLTKGNTGRIEIQTKAEGPILSLKSRREERQIQFIPTISSNLPGYVEKQDQVCCSSSSSGSVSAAEETIIRSLKRLVLKKELLMSQTSRENPKPKPKGKGRRCGKCGKRGHNSRTCEDWCHSDEESS